MSARPVVILPLLMALALAGAVFSAVQKSPTRTIGWPPTPDNEAAQLQIEKLALRPGDRFKGRSLTLLQVNAPGEAGWYPGAFDVLYATWRVPLGYDFTNDARAFGVPTANEYGHWISPPGLALMAAAFYDPRDAIGRAYQIPRVLRPNLARLMGVSLVVADAPIEGRTPLYAAGENAPPLYLYGIDDPNTGHYSPVETLTAGDAHAILDALQAPDFDGRRVAVLESPPPVSTLVPADDVEVRLEKGPLLRVTGRSEGVSLLALPFDWSHCLRAEGPGLVDLMPVNLAQSGLLVQGTFEVEIAYEYGLLTDLSCRTDDLERARALDLENAATGRLFKDSRPAP